MSFFRKLKSSPTPLFFAFLSLSGPAPRVSDTTVPQCFNKHLARLLDRISPGAAEQTITVDDPTPVQRLTRLEKKRLSPSLEGKNVQGLDLNLRVVNEHEFQEDLVILRGKGLWIFMTPSDILARVASGHFLIGTDTHLFNRSVDQAGPQAMTSLTWESAFQDPIISGLVQNDFVMAQYFEIRQESVLALDHFLHDRVWNYHAGHSAYQSQYQPLPFSQGEGQSNCENCLTFTYPWFDSRWTTLRPELKAIAREMGGLRMSEIPSRQVFLNTQASAYRGTLLISSHPDRLIKDLTSDGGASNTALQQLLFEGPLHAPRH